MAFTQAMLEEVVAWCWQSHELAADRRQAWQVFFGEDEGQPVSYWANTGELSSRERRFLGYFLFQWTLPSGIKPAEVAVQRLYAHDPGVEAIAAVAGARFVLAIVASAAGPSVRLELAKERFEVRNRLWARTLVRGTALATHLVPLRSGYWLAGPGWVNLPFELGPGIRANLADWQTDPVGIERMLQGRAAGASEPVRPEAPNDSDLDAASARMTAWAMQHGEDGLVMAAIDWQSLVLKHLKSPIITSFYEEAMERISALSSEDDLHELAGLLSNIWNNTPQPDRGGKTANELVRERSTLKRRSRSP